MSLHRFIIIGIISIGGKKSKIYMEPLNGAAWHDGDPMGWLNPTIHRLEGENTQKWIPYLTWFGQHCLHPRRGFFFFTKSMEIKLHKWP